MSQPATSTLVFGIYLILVGLAQMLVPNQILTLLGLPETQEVWFRALGLVMVVLGYHCLVAARSEDLPFFQAALVTMPFTIVVLIAFVALGFVGPSLLLLAVVNAVFLAWVWWGP